ncbi:MAG: hypothetical protein H8E44_40625 [Planctomycetes bacterium]|nr:hypothetical protein [Planctomycetota bacterium]MBL7039614.1 hypothetical protein [Pirellulaceae bacterium]
MILRCRTRSLDAGFLVLFVALFSNVSHGAQPAPEESAVKPARKNVKLPGLVINFQERCVDLEGSICLDEGMLELIACTKQTKEHESIVVVHARPMHIHTALLLLGAQSGNPAMRRPIGEGGTRWVDIPPRGDPVDIYLVFSNKHGKAVERPISDFVTRSEKDPDGLFGALEGDAHEVDKDNREKFPKTFLFAGSLLVGDGPGARTYLADRSGSVISIATFGDELLCLPGVHAKANDTLMWQIDAMHLPEVGSKVTLRLRPQNKPSAKTDEAEKQQPKDGCEKDQK